MELATTQDKMGAAEARLAVMAVEGARAEALVADLAAAQKKFAAATQQRHV